MLTLVAGFVLGFVSSLQLMGPVALLVFSNAIKQQYKKAILISLGATIPETIYCFLAVYGFKFIFEKYPFLKSASESVGAVVMIALGLLFFLSKPLQNDSEQVEPERKRSLFGAFLLGLSISSVNPILIASWSAVIAMLFSIFEPFNEIQSLLFPFFVSAGLFLASVCVVLLIKKHRDRVTPSVMNGIVRGFGLVMLLIGLVFGTKLLIKLA